LVLTYISSALPGMLRSSLPTENCGWVKPKLRFRDRSTSLGSCNATMAEVLVLSHGVAFVLPFLFSSRCCVVKFEESSECDVKIGEEK